MNLPQAFRFSLIFTLLSVLSSVIGQTPSAKQILSHPRFDLAGEDDYMDEIRSGKRRITDYDKYERQKDCLCLSHFKDPHCGSDNKVYDNGCFFLCAQDRKRGLRLKRWGNCEDDEDEFLENMLVDKDYDFEDSANIAKGYVEI